MDASWCAHRRNRDCTPKSATAQHGFVGFSRDPARRTPHDETDGQMGRLLQRLQAMKPNRTAISMLQGHKCILKRFKAPHDFFRIQLLRSGCRNKQALTGRGLFVQVQCRTPRNCTASSFSAYRFASMRKSGRTESVFDCQTQSRRLQEAGLA